jgi:hypothetical protein
MRFAEVLNIVIPACPESFLFPLNKGGQGGCYK